MEIPQKSPDDNLEIPHDINSAFNTWRWTFKVKGKTACVALSGEQATEMLQAIENHKRVEEIVREMREITQTSILETVPGIRRRKPISELPKAR